MFSLCKGSGHVSVVDATCLNSMNVIVHLTLGLNEVQCESREVENEQRSMLSEVRLG